MDKQPKELLKPKTPSSTGAKWNKSPTKAATTSNDSSSNSDNFDIDSILARHREEMEKQEPSQSAESTTSSTAEVNILPPTQVISQLLKMQVVHQATTRFGEEVYAAMERYKKALSQSTTTTTSSIESTLKQASSLADVQQMDEVTILFNSCTQGLREAAKDGDDSVGSALSNQETLDCLVVLLALYNAASLQDLPKSKLRQLAAELVGGLFAYNAGALVDAVTRQLKTLSGQMYFGSMEHFDVLECFVFLPVCQLSHDRLLCSLSLLGSLFNLNQEKVKKEVVSATSLEDLLLSLVTLNSFFSESAGLGCKRAKRICQAIKDFARRHLFISLSGKTPNLSRKIQKPSGNSRHLTALLTAFLRLIHFLKKHICPFDNKKHLWRENEATIDDLWYWLASLLQSLDTIGADCGTGSPLLQWEEREWRDKDDESSQEHELCRLLYLHFENSFGRFLSVFSAASHYH